MRDAYSYKTDIGTFTYLEENNAITSISLNEIHTNTKETKLIKQAHQEMMEYLKEERFDFTFPIHYSGTAFQEKVWHALLEIPYGKTKSYKEIANQIGHDKASRAVGSACKNNPLLIVVPCHRVIASNGKLTGYAYGLSLKEKLLTLESR